MKVKWSPLKRSMESGCRAKMKSSSSRRTAFGSRASRQRRQPKSLKRRKASSINFLESSYGKNNLFHRNTAAPFRPVGGENIAEVPVTDGKDRMVAEPR